MKIKCVCGGTIIDQSDYLPDKAHIFPDENYFQLLEAIDDAVKKSGPSAAEKEAAAMNVRSLILNIKKLMYQCCDCGRIYINGHAPLWSIYQFNPDDEAIPRELLRSKVVLIEKS